MNEASHASRRDYFLRLHRSYLGQSPAAKMTALDSSASSLTTRQREVLACLVRGESNKQIARSLGVAEGTVKVHLAAIFQKLKVSSRAAAAVAGANLAAIEPR